MKRAAHWAFGIGLILLLWSTQTQAQSAAATVRPQSPAAPLAVGQIFNLNITISGATDLYGIDLGLTFDPALLQVVDADPAREGVQARPGTIPAPDFVATAAADNALGRIRYAVTQINPTPPAAGDGIVFSVEIRAVAAGSSSLTFAFAEAADRDGQALPLVTEGTIIEVAAAAPTGIPLQGTEAPGDGQTATSTTSSPAATQLPASTATVEDNQPPPATLTLLTRTAPDAPVPAATTGAVIAGTEAAPTSTGSPAAASQPVETTISPAAAGKLTAPATAPAIAPATTPAPATAAATAPAQTPHVVGAVSAAGSAAATNPAPAPEASGATTIGPTAILGLTVGLVVFAAVVYLVIRSNHRGKAADTDQRL